ncbi:MAG: DUF4870 domain-containing protein [Propionibacteriales bacterium]|nr:DUF4870 domain-containing protein [Propionibacteriales bacterium]
MAAHLGPLLIGFLAPLIVMILVDKRSAFARQQAVEALNFQLSFLLYAIVAAFSLLLLIGLLLLPVVGVLWLVFMVIAAVRSSNGEPYRYPLTIRMVT